MPVFLGHGKADPLVGVSLALRTKAALTASGVERDTLEVT